MVVRRGAYDLSPAMLPIVSRFTPHSFANSTAVIPCLSSHRPKGVRGFPNPNMSSHLITRMDEYSENYTCVRKKFRIMAEPLRIYSTSDNEARWRS